MELIFKNSKEILHELKHINGNNLPIEIEKYLTETFDDSVVVAYEFKFTNETKVKDLHNGLENIPVENVTSIIITIKD